MTILDVILAIGVVQLLVVVFGAGGIVYTVRRNARDIQQLRVDLDRHMETERDNIEKLMQAVARLQAKVENGR